MRLCYAPAGCVAALSAPSSVGGGQRIVHFARAAVLGLLAGVRAPASVPLTVVGIVADGATYRPFRGNAPLRLLTDA